MGQYIHRCRKTVTNVAVSQRSMYVTYTICVASSSRDFITFELIIVAKTRVDTSSLTIINIQSWRWSDAGVETWRCSQQANKTCATRNGSTKQR